MTAELSDALRDARLQLVADAISGGALTLYTAPKPAKGAAITTQTALSVTTIPAGLTAVGAAVDLLLPSVTILADGTAAWGRITASGGGFVLDGDCGLESSPAFFKLRSLTLSAGNTLTTITTQIMEP